MIKQFLVLIFMLSGSVAIAQHYSIRGSVVEQQGEALPYASVFLLQVQDSVVLASTTTDAAGRFLLKGLKKDEYLLKITFVGYNPFLKRIKPSESKVIQMGVLRLQPLETELAAITIMGEREAIIVKEDTVAYYANAYHTRSNANVEQLLKKLPGLDLQCDGTISVQGQAVTRIFVDGKEFFGGDVKMATRNLPADAIETVEVIDGKSEEALFSGIDDGKREKVINLSLKKERKDMGFGKAMAGGGTQSRYIGQGSYNRFSEGKQLSLMGMSNNINIQDQTGGEELGAHEGAAEAVNQPGLQRIHRGGGHLFDQLNAKTSVIASYQLNHNNLSLRENVVRQNFLPEGTALYYENSLQQSKQKGHMLHTTLEHKGGNNTLRLNTVLNYSAIHTTSTIHRQSFAVDDSLVNEGERRAQLDNKNMSMLTSLFWGHRFDKKGRLLTLNGQLSANDNNTQGLSEAFTHFRGAADEVLHQQNEQQNDNLNYSLRFAYTEPLGNKQYLQANYNIANRRSESVQEVWDIFNETRLLNDEQSNHFRNTFLSQQAGLSYRLNHQNYNLVLGANLQYCILGRRLLPLGDVETQSFQNLLPNAMLSIKLGSTSRLNFSYSTFVREPSINQLQPVVSRFDPLNVLLGNPDLRPEYRHQGKISFTSSSPASGVFLSSSLALNYTANPIVAAVQVSEQQVRTTQYVNLGQSSDMAAFVNLGIPLKRFNSRFNFSPFLRLGQSMNLLNGVEGTIRQSSMGGNVDWAYQYKEVLDLNLRSSIGLNRSSYELNEQQDQLFVNATHGAALALQVLKDFWFTSDFCYTQFRNQQTDFKQGIPVLNFSLSRFILPDNKGELRLSAVNVLNQNVGVSQFATINYIEQSVQNSLGNYYMLSFTYHFNPKAAE